MKENLYSISQYVQELIEDDPDCRLQCMNQLIMALLDRILDGNTPHRTPSTLMK